MNIYKSGVKLPRQDEYRLWRHEHMYFDSFGKIDKATTEDKERNGATGNRTRVIGKAPCHYRNRLSQIR
jgi:hypothetical protein